MMQPTGSRHHQQCKKKIERVSHHVEGWANREDFTEILCDRVVPIELRDSRLFMAKKSVDSAEQSTKTGRRHTMMGPRQKRDSFNTSQSPVSLLPWETT